jgi:hypothetical protein
MTFMTAKIHVLHPQAAPLSGFLRVGHTGHRKLEALYAAGRFPYRRVVFDAAHIGEQQELLKMLRTSGCEIVLDPNFAEMSMLGRFGSAVTKLPWANLERPWEASDFARGRNLDTTKLIAEFALKQGVNVVLAPAHLIEQNSTSWRPIDLRTCEALRHELNRLGGANIAIDYQLITTNALLKDEQARGELIDGLDSLPIENVWLRTSGFGATATGVGTRHFIEAVRGMHHIGLPLVVDGVGGFPGLAAAAFGAVGGISHGVAQKENFDANDWRKPPQRNGGGAATRIYVHELDRYFTADQLNAIFNARGGRSRFGCNDTNCCHHGPEDMIENSHIHFITQRFRQIDDLAGVPEARRAEHFLLRHVDPAVRSARLGAHLKLADEKVEMAMNNVKSRLVRLRDALGDLQATEGTPSRSRSPAFRGGAHSSRAVLGQ